MPGDFRLPLRGAESTWPASPGLRPGATLRRPSGANRDKELPPARFPTRKRGANVARSLRGERRKDLPDRLLSDYWLLVAAVLLRAGGYGLRSCCCRPSAATARPGRAHRRRFGPERP